MGASASARGQNPEASSPAQQNTQESNEGITSSNSKKVPNLILRTILKEASVQSPLASAPSYGVFDRYRGSKELEKLFCRIYKQKDGILKKVRAQDSFAIPEEERGLICWRERGDTDGDGRGTVKYAWLSSKARPGFRVSSEWTLYIECVNPSKTTPASGSSSSGAFVEIRRYPNTSVDAEDENLGTYKSTSINPGEMSVRINDVPIEINVRVGPLPSFAVIEMNESAVFWWRTKEALDFVPKKTRPIRSFVDSQGYENLGAALPAFKRQKLSSNTAINRLRGSVARNEEEESFQSPSAPTEVQYKGNDAGDATPTTAASSNTAAMSSTAAPPNTTASPKTAIADNTDTAINPAPSEAGTKNAEKSVKSHPKKAPHVGKTQGFNEPSSALPRPNWKAKFERGLRRHKESQRHEVVPQILHQIDYSGLDAEITKKSPLHDCKNLFDEEVVKGIATLWTALQNQGKYFAFGSTNTFIGYRSVDFHDMKEPAVKGPNYPFIMPLVFAPRSDNTKHGHPNSEFDPSKARPLPTTGHHILAVARVTDGPIIVTVLDTMPHLLECARIEEVVTDVVTRSGWLGKDKNDLPLPVWPTVKFEYPKVPEQEDSNTCGIYVILNAWATMLELEIAPQKARLLLPQGTPKIPFLTSAIDLINLAIAGHLDTETIVAFFFSYGYILEPRDPNSIPNVRLDQNLNQNLVKQAIYESRQKDTGELPKDPIQVAEDDVQRIMDKTGCTPKCAKRAVENARGILNVAPFFVPPERRGKYYLATRDGPVAVAK